MPFTKSNQNVSIHFDDASASYMKALLTAEIESHSDPVEKAMIQELFTELKGCISVAFGPAFWDSL